MGGRLSGRDMWAAIGIQSAKGTAAKYGSFYQIDDVGGILEEYSAIESNRRVGSRFKGAGYLGSKSVPWSLTIEANTKNIGHLLYAALGSEVGAPLTTPTRYQHTFSILQELKYITIDLYSAGVADNSGTDKFHVILDAKVGAFQISGGTDDVTMVTMSGTGMTRSPVVTAMTGTAGGVSFDEVTVTSTVGLIAGMKVVTNGDPIVTTTIVTVDSATQFTMAAGSEGATTFTLSPVFIAGKPLFFTSDEGTGLIEIGATIGATSQFDESNEFELSMDDGLSPDHRIRGASAPFGMEEGESTMDGRMVVVYNETSFVEIDAFQIGTDRALWTKWTSKNLIADAVYESLDIKISKARYTGTPPSWDPDIISVELPFRAEPVSGFSTILVDAISTQYDAANTAIT